MACCAFVAKSSELKQGGSSAGKNSYCSNLFGSNIRKSSRNNFPFSLAQSVRNVKFKRQWKCTVVGGSSFSAGSAGRDLPGQRMISRWDAMVWGERLGCVRRPEPFFGIGFGVRGVAESGTGFLYLRPEKTAEGVLTINA